MPQTLKRLFIDHPAEVDETFFEHLCFAGCFAGRLATAALAALAHALVPGLFQKTASNIVRELHVKTANRG